MYSGVGIVHLSFAVNVFLFPPSFGLAVRRNDKLWQGCGRNPDFTAKTDITDNFPLNRISKLRVCNTPGLHPAYRLIRH
jgi:hypothetical protein